MSFEEGKKKRCVNSAQDLEEHQEMRKPGKCIIDKFQSSQLLTICTAKIN